MGAEQCQPSTGLSNDSESIQWELVPSQCKMQQTFSIPAKRKIRLECTVP